MESFRVIVRNATGTPEEWGQVRNVPAKGLPELTGEQKRIVNRWGISDEDYKRSVLLASLAERRFESQGSTLGRAIDEVLKVLGYALSAVIVEAALGKWIIRVETPKKDMVDLEITPELRSKAMRNGDIADQEALRRELLAQLGRQDLIGKR
jgi:hypothetical protein